MIDQNSMVRLDIANHPKLAILNIRFDKNIKSYITIQNRSILGLLHNFSSN